MQHERAARNRFQSKRVLVSQREVLFARLLLRTADAIASKDRDQEFISLYNDIKAVAESTLRDGTSEA